MRYQPETITTQEDLNAFIESRQDNGCSKCESCFKCCEPDCNVAQVEVIKWNVRQNELKGNERKFSP